LWNLKKLFFFLLWMVCLNQYPRFLFLIWCYLCCLILTCLSNVREDHRDSDILTLIPNIHSDYVFVWCKVHIFWHPILCFCSYISLHLHVFHFVGFGNSIRFRVYIGVYINHHVMESNDCYCDCDWEAKVGYDIGITLREPYSYILDCCHYQESTFPTPFCVMLLWILSYH
jgi:hypothetical protein